MKFICEKNKLQDAIAIAQKAITGRTTMPILEGMYIECKDSTITFIGSDKDVSIETKIEANILEAGSIVVDAKMLGEIVRKLPNAEVTISTEENNILKIECLKSVFDVIHMSSEEFPSLPTIDVDKAFNIPQGLLKNMIKGTSFATAQDETRPILQGILFEVRDSKFNLVALDGYRLALRREFIDNTNDISRVIPGKTFNEVSKILDDANTIVEIMFTKNHILFDMGKTRIISRLLEGDFISYSSLLPKEHKILVEVNKQELQNGIERASLMAKDGNTNLVKFNISNDNLIITSNSQLGKVREEVSVEMQGEDLQIAFNSKYLIDVLKSMEEETIQLKLTSSVAPCIIKNKDNDDCEYLVLPVRMAK